VNEIRKPRVKLGKIGTSFRLDGGWAQMFGDSKGRVYRRWRHRRWREHWNLVTRIYDGRALPKEG
jgi:hypothetical protein